MERISRVATVFGFILLFAIAICADFAYGDTSESRPPDNRPPAKEQPSPPPQIDVAQDQMQDQEQGQDQAQDQGQQQTQNSSSNNSIDIEDEKQAPGMALSTASDSLGIGITTPVGGFLLNLPWSFGDKKILPVCDRLLNKPGEWNGCICLTSVMKRLHDDHATCVTSLGGGSGGKLGSAFFVASTITSEEHDDLSQQIFALKAELAKSQERQQVQDRQQQIQQQVQQYDHDSKARAFKLLEQLTDYEEPKKNE